MDQLLDPQIRKSCESYPDMNDKYDIVVHDNFKVLMVAAIPEVS